MIHYSLLKSDKTNAQNIVILHGLLGSGDNWKSIAKTLTQTHNVYCLDLPNHGLSTSLEQFDYPILAQLIATFITDYQLEGCVLLGHSMGGKVAMQLAHNHNELISKLIVVDIAPKFYKNSHQSIFEAIKSVDLTNIKQRREVDKQMSTLIPEVGIRAFILKSLFKNKETGLFEWMFNWQFLINQYEKIADSPKLTSTINIPTLFIKGETSDYLQADDQSLIKSLFSDSKARLILGAGHWPHVEKQEMFLKELKRFL
ncbi:MAG: alpha/beta fold hydrolase [Saccharospirillaceae bacterium]|nr:alpha/beta fold hydrolase [Pseudomonadales bacterium]NRB79980.1 alpha/beta fold hydrolase [Saccharospirillaceae bacterium]